MKKFKLTEITTDKKRKGWFNFIHISTSTCIAMVSPKIAADLKKLLSPQRGEGGG